MLKWSICTLMLAGIASSGDVQAEQGHPPAWSYECHTIDKKILLGRMKELLTYGHVNDARGPSYALTVYKGGVDGSFSVRAIGYENVHKPGCFDLRIEKSAMEKYLVQLAKQEEISDFVRISLSNRFDGVTSIIALLHPDDRVTYYLGDEMGQKLLDLAGAADHFDTRKNKPAAENIENEGPIDPPGFENCEGAFECAGLNP